MKKIALPLTLIALSLLLIAMVSGCSNIPQPPMPQPSAPEPAVPTDEVPEVAEPEILEEDVAEPELIIPENNTLLYQGNGSLRIATPEGKIIYIDPWAGSGYNVPADLILVTHDHDDHKDVKLITEKNPDCQKITWQETVKTTYTEDYQIKSREYQTDIDLGYIKIDATAGCHTGGAGYVLTLSNGITVYVGGDVNEMSDELVTQLAAYNLDYAFFSCDEVWTMNVAEASAYAARIKAKHSIPYHTNWPSYFSREIAEQFQVEGRMIIEPGDEMALE